MILFKELRITSDKKHLVVECNITNSSYYTNIYISLIIVDTLKTYVSTGPSSKPIFSKTYSDLEQVVREVFDIDSISDNLFFVYVLAEGELADDTPCGMTDKLAIGTVFDLEMLYNTSMKLINEVDGCDVPRNFIDLILRLEAFELSLHLGEYSKAIEYWNAFFTENTITTVKTNCGCYVGS